VPALSRMLNFLWKYPMTSYPLVSEVFFMCLRIIMSMKFWIVLRLNVATVLDSKVNTVSKVLYVLEYNSMCL